MNRSENMTKGLHIKVEPSLDRELRRLAGDSGVSVGELIRRAVRRTYHIGLEGLSGDHRAALTAYEAGYISLGKLSEELGMDAVTLRRWLQDNGMVSGETFSAADADHV